jgi:hypothetical protein
VSTLDEAKQVVSKKLLGKYGIHAVGRRSKTQEVVLYFDEATPDDVVETVKRNAQLLVGIYSIAVDRTPRAGLK